MKTIELFRANGYLQSCDAIIVDIDSNKLMTDQTVFYPEGGGQPGDIGSLISRNGEELQITDTLKDEQTGQHYHVLAQPESLLGIGEKVTLKIDWARRYRLMRMHSCLHMLCAIIPAGVTGGSIQDGRGRLDFDLPKPVDKTDIMRDLQRLIDSDRPMSLSWIKDKELLLKPELVRTMSIKPPQGEENVRLVDFDGIDLQPCGGTHVASTKEIGKVSIRKIEKKGKRNRRIIVELADE
jgi:misacylated tRNA(Ala) deacylase